MLNYKVIDILKSFTSEENKRFGDFLNSPFHNKNKKAIALFQILTKYHPAYESKKLTREKLFEEIFIDVGSGYNDASMRNLFSDLMILTEKFLSYCRFEKDKFDFNEKCLREILDRNLSAVFQKKLRSTEELLISGEFKGEQQFYQRFVLEELRSLSRQFSDDLKLYKNDSNLRASEYLTYYYLTKVFKMINFFEFQKQYNVKHELNIVKDILGDLNIDKTISELLKTSDSKGDILIFQVYYKMYRSITNPANDEFYFDYKKILLLNEHLFSRLESLGLFICLTNSCVQKIDSGKDEFSRECFEIYMVMFEKDLYSVYPGYFPMAAFSAILHTGLAAKEYTKVEDFIKEYTIKLNPEHRNDAVNYSMAQLNFQNKNFGKSLEYISRTDTEFTQFKFLLKILSLKIYYELQDDELLYYASDSFQHFLNKNKLVGETYKTEFGNFIKILDLIVRYRSLRDHKLLDKIKFQLEKKNIAGRKWLIEKLDEINK